MRLLALACAVLAVGVAGAARADDSGRIVGSVLVNPLSVDVTRPDDPSPKGRWFRVVAQAANDGSTRLDGVAVTLVRPQALQLRSSVTQTIARIPAGASRRAHWEACSNTPGNYVVLARAQVGPFTVESPGIVVQINQSNRTC